MTDIKPMLAAPQKSEKLATLVGSHTFDLKLDGIRCVLYWLNGGLRLVNRSGIDITHRFPELGGLSWPFDVVLDGELMARTGLFQDTAKRDKQNKPGDVAIWSQRMPCTFVAFDMLHLAGNDLRNQGYVVRRNLLEEHAPAQGELLSHSVISSDPTFFDTVKAAGGEGVIAKRNHSTYRPGRSGDWIKFKTIRSVTCVATGYEKGTGARAHFGAMFLHMIDANGQAVAVGRVGTGFKKAEIDMLKGELDAGRPVLVEIECLNVTRDGSLRFPAYKGVRTDLSYLDARLDQLDSIPRC